MVISSLPLFFGRFSMLTLCETSKKAIETGHNWFVDLPKKHGDFPVRYVSLQFTRVYPIYKWLFSRSVGWSSLHSCPGSPATVPELHTVQPARIPPVQENGMNSCGRNPASVDRWFISLFKGFQPSFWWCRISSMHSISCGYHRNNHGIFMG